ncbi:MAG: hypothetical protein U1E26_00450 [Coriobacteriia bacterium]|nr:hypothetical protein [Coriobacteriia bacterium]
MDELLDEDRVTVLVALGIDENEDAGLLRQVWKERGLTEPVAISPGPLTAALIQEFGPEIVTPPQAPIVLISADQTSARLLPSGLKDIEELKSEIAKGR